MRAELQRLTWQRGISLRASATATTRLHYTPSSSTAHPALLLTTLRALAGPRSSTNITAQTTQAALACQRGRGAQNENAVSLRFDDALGRVIGWKAPRLVLVRGNVFDLDPGSRPRGRSPPPPLLPSFSYLSLHPLAAPWPGATCRVTHEVPLLDEGKCDHCYSRHRQMFSRSRRAWG